MTRPHNWLPPAQKSLRLGLPVLSLAACLVLLSLPAQAHKRDFAWSYQWFTPFPGEKEIETWSTYKDSTSQWEHQLEYEFAASPRHAVGLYLLVDSGSDAGLDFHGWKWENRYRFGEFADDRWLPAAYLELKKERGESYEMEAKWLLSRYSSRGDALALNLIAERHLESGADVEWGLTAGWSRWMAPRWRVGFESKAEWEDDEYYVGPVFSLDLSPNSRVIASALKGLTADSEEVLFRVLTEYEWF